MQERDFDEMATSEMDEQSSGEAPPERGFKKTKVGWIPEEWEVRQMRDVVQDVSAGRSIGGEDRTIEDGEKGVLRTSAVTSGKFIPEEHKVVDPEDYDRLKRSPAEGDILFNRASGSLELVGVSVQVSSDYPNLFLSDKLWRIKADQDVSEKWLHYALESEHVVGRIRMYADSRSTGMKNIPQGDFLTIRVATPPPEEQRHIAQVLGSWDRAIEQIDDLIAVKERRKKALMQQLLKGKTRVPGYAGQDWQEKRLGDYFEYFSNRNREEEELTVLSCSKVHGIIPQEDKFDKRVASKDTSNYKVVEEGDLVYDPMLLWDGSIGFLKDVQKGVVSPAYYTFKFEGDDLDQVFFEHLLESHYVQYQYEAISQGTNTRRQKAPRQAFLGIEVEVPPREERHAIAKILGKVGDELQMLREERDALQRQKKGIMQKLLKGRIRASTDITYPQAEA